MSNPIKNLILRNNQDNRQISITEEGFRNLEKASENSSWVKVGYDNPQDILPCWYISDRVRMEAIKNQKPFSEFYNASEYFRIFKRIDNSHIEGFLGRYDQEYTFHEKIENGLTYFDDFLRRQKVYFTFDKISLYQVVEIYPERPLKFILKRIDNLKNFKVNQAFMIMPFHKPALDSFYFDNIKPYLKSTFNIEIYRADDFRDNDIIVQTIYNLIEESEFIIADTTLENKNAFYELGYASAIGKEIIMIQDKSVEQRLFFDRAHIRTIMYDAADIDAFHFDLSATIKSIRDRQ
jgi:hypothetical protein